MNVDHETMAELLRHTAELSEMRESSRVICLGKGGHFIREGDMSTDIGIVSRGLCRSYYIDADGNDVTKYFYAEGGMLFSYAAHISKTPSKYGIEALEDSEIRAIGIGDFERIVSGNYEMLSLYKKIIDGMLVRKEEHALSFKLLDGVGRYRQFIAENPGLESRVLQRHLASYLGMTPVSLSRIRKRIGINK